RCTGRDGAVSVSFEEEALRRAYLHRECIASCLDYPARCTDSTHIRTVPSISNQRAPAGARFGGRSCARRATGALTVAIFIGLLSGCSGMLRASGILPPPEGRRYVPVD